MKRFGKTGRYRFHDLSLEVSQEEPVTGVGLLPLLQDLSFVSFHAEKKKASLCLSIRIRDQVLHPSCAVREVFRIDGLCGRESGNDFYLTEGTSLFHLQVLKGEGEATLAHSFFQQPSILQQQFWGFGLLKLLRPLGL